MSASSSPARQLSFRSTVHAVLNPEIFFADLLAPLATLPSGLFLTLLVLLLTATPVARSQSLRFVPVLTNVTAVNGVSGAVILNAPAAVATDPQGNLYIADTNNELIRKVSPARVATIFAGNGAYGYSGDGGQAIKASIATPIALATDAAGNVYFSDRDDCAVRKISTNGIITTVAGGHGPGSSGDGGLATAAQISPGGLASDALGNLYVIDTISNTVRMISTGGTIFTYAGGGTLQGSLGNNGPATLAQLISLQSIALDANGNLYIADNGFKHVRKVDASGIIITFAGNGTPGNGGDGGLAINAQLGTTYAVATDNSGNVFIGDPASDNVRMVNSAGIISTIAGNGLTREVGDGVAADQAGIGEPRSLAVDVLGNLFIAVPSRDAIYAVAMHPERFPETKVGASSNPQRLAIENYGASDITISGVTFNGDFKVSTLAVGGDYCYTGDLLQKGNFCVVDAVFAPTAEGIRAFPLTISSNDTPPTVTQTLTSTGLGSALAMTSGEMYTVAGNRNAAVNETVITTGIPATSIGLFATGGIAVDSTGDLFIAQGCQVQRVDGNTGLLTTYGGLDQTTCTTYFNGNRVTIFGDEGAATAAYMPTVGALTLDSTNRLFISDVFDSRIRMIDPAGFIHTYAGAGVGVGNSSSCFYTPDGIFAAAAFLCFPQGMAFDPAGNLYFAETGNSLIRVVSVTDDKIYTVAGNRALGAGFSGDGGAATSAQINQPYGLVINSAGDIFFSDQLNMVVRKITKATGKISTIAGQQGVQGYSGDGGLAIHSKLNFPAGLAIDAAGDLFIADDSNWVIRKIDTAGYITTVAGNHLDNYDYGDGFAATNSGLDFPHDIAVGASGSLYISDTYARLVREVSPNGALIFDPQAVGTTSRPQNVTLSNIGNTPLHFDAQFPTGITGDFAQSGGNCDFTAPLAVGAHCIVNLTFTPTAAGGRNGIFGLFDDGVASPQYVALSGTGTQAQAQTIHFGALTDKIYGSADFLIPASSTSGLPVVLTVKSGHATLTGNNLHITGVGPIVIAANQAGSAGAWLPATEVTQSFTVTPATLGIIATNISISMGDPIPAFTYTISPFANFVNGDSPSVLTGAPVFSTTATSASAQGVYTLTIAKGTLAASNYTIILSNGSVTIGPAKVPPPPVKLAAAATIARAADHYTVTVTVTNSGGVAAQGVVLTSLKLNSVAGTPASKAVGSVTAGGSVVVTISVPLSAGASETNGIEQIAGTYTGGTFGGTYRVTLP